MSKVLQPDPGYDWICQRCSHQWRSRVPGLPPPPQCAKCRSAYWSRPKTSKAGKSGGTKLRRTEPKRTEPKPARSEPEGHPLLSPPPHLRQTYRPPEPEPQPENTIRKPLDWNESVVESKTDPIVPTAEVVETDQGDQDATQDIHDTPETVHDT